MHPHSRMCVPWNCKTRDTAANTFCFRTVCFRLVCTILYCIVFRAFEDLDFCKQCCFCSDYWAFQLYQRRRCSPPPKRLRVEEAFGWHLSRLGDRDLCVGVRTKLLSLFEALVTKSLRRDIWEGG